MKLALISSMFIFFMLTGIGLKAGDIRVQLTTWTQPSHRLGEYGCTNFCCDISSFLRGSQVFYASFKNSFDF